MNYSGYLFHVRKLTHSESYLSRSVSGEEFIIRSESMGKERKGVERRKYMYRTAFRKGMDSDISISMGTWKV